MRDLSKEQRNYVGQMNNVLTNFFNQALKVCTANPIMFYFLFKFRKRLKKASVIRKHWEEQGVHVPPYIIASITNKCNLKCKGCYANAHKRPQGDELMVERWREIFSEARELGTSVIFLAGGEPFARPDILELIGDFNEIVFPVFTNGTMIDETMVNKLKKLKNLVPVISIEGYEAYTDERRGKGIYENVRSIMKKLKKNRVFFGASLTVTSKNMDTIISDGFIEGLMDAGCRLFMFVEYVAVEQGTEKLLLDNSQRLRMRGIIDELPSKYKALFVSFPGDEDQYGGCLAAGRGFIHISSEGNLEPCPFSPYSDTSLKNVSLREALRSEFLRKIRENHDRLAETRGGCALWNNREWVASILNVSRDEDRPNEQCSI